MANPIDALARDLGDALDLITFDLRKHTPIDGLTDSEEDAIYAASLSAGGLKLILENIIERLKVRNGGPVGAFPDVDRPRVVVRFPSVVPGPSDVRSGGDLVTGETV